MNDEITQRKIITQADENLGPLLRLRSRECDFPLSEEDKAAILDMEAVLLREIDSNSAVGLAAVQIGHPRRIFNLQLSDGTIEFFINPEITMRSREVSKKEEGCLSLPGVFFRIPRPKTVRIKYFDVNGEVHERDFSGLMARAICHEMDHLNGVLLIDKLEKLIAKATTKGGKRKQYHKSYRQPSHSLAWVRSRNGRRK
jgi:peptide deformylase